MLKVSRFNPIKRFALLINNFDNLQSDDSANGKYSRLSKYWEGNQAVHKLECALQRGKPDFSPEVKHELIANINREAAFQYYSITRTVVDHYLSQSKKQDYFDKKDELSQLFPGAVADIASKAFDLLDYIKPGEIHLFAPISQPIRYDRVRKIFPDAPSPSNEALNILEQFRKLADPNSLTVIFYKASEPGHIADLSFYDLIKYLDVIPGKKVLIALRQFPSAQLDLITRQPRRTNFAFLQPMMSPRGESQEEHDSLEKLCQNIRSGRPIGSFIPRFFQVHAPFSVLL